MRFHATLYNHRDRDILQLFSLQHPGKRGTTWTIWFTQKRPGKQLIQRTVYL